MRSPTLLAAALLAAASLGASSAAAQNNAARHTFTIGSEDFLLDGKPYVIRCGELHFPRVPREYWEHRLKMAHAMGLNAVCVYLFWNYHEFEEGKFDWEGQKDAAEFCRMAQKEGMWVILRPGPYSCAEWDMGGIPWWLLKHDGIKLRTSDPKFLEPAKRYLKEVGRVLGPLQITRGGPILMTQVENEYGSFGNDTVYMGALRQALIDSGFDVPLFACNPPADIKNGFRSDLFQVVNFGSGAQKAFDTLKQFQKTGPLMNGEFYPGWFDGWGRAHHTGSGKSYIDDLRYMLENKRSFSIYMAHGGTTFGLWSGADRPYQPDTSSYDYDAPITEAAWPGDKFSATRELFAKYLQPGETIPEPPARNPVIEIAPFAFAEKSFVGWNLPAPKREDQPRPMEHYDQGHGCILYRTTLPPGPAGTLSARAAQDFAWVSVDGKPVGVMDRRSKRYRVPIPARTAPAQVDVFIETMGHVNFGTELHDPKGLLTPVQFAAGEGAATEIKGWEVYSFPLDDAQLASLKYGALASAKQSPEPVGPAFWRATFEVTQPGDTFLDVRALGKGVAWVNGHCLGRYWNIGPTQTMYIPGPWLKAGKNEIVVFDLLPLKDPKLAGLSKPILDQLRPELDFARRERAKGTFDAAGAFSAQGTFTQNVQWQDVKFLRPAKGRYVCLESLNTFDPRKVSAVAEFDAIGADGKSLSRAGWKILWVSSEETSAESCDAENALDGQSNSFWHTQYKPEPTAFPHRIVLDLGETQELGGIRYLPRAGDAGQPGRIKDYRVYVSDKPFGLSVQP